MGAKQNNESHETEFAASEGSPTTKSTSELLLGMVDASMVPSLNLVRSSFASDLFFRFTRTYNSLWTFFSRDDHFRKAFLILLHQSLQAKKWQQKILRTKTTLSGMGRLYQNLSRCMNQIKTARKY